MKKIKIRAEHRQLLSDTATPVGIYLSLREQFDVVSLLESNDSRSSENSKSIIGFDPLLVVQVANQEMVGTLCGKEVHRKILESPMQLADDFKLLMDHIEIENLSEGPTTGFVGHTCFDAVRHFDTMAFDPAKRNVDIPDLHYIFYRYFVTIDHFHEILHLTENRLEDDQSNLDETEKYLFAHHRPKSDFNTIGEETSNLTDAEFRELVSRGKYHCRIGDVFQIVLSRQFHQKFSGDEFNVYRILRSINPSPYLYFFNFGSYKIFGSSPEAQLVIRDDTATLNPIAGTYRRSGDDDEDLRMAQALAKDPKEVAEHIMLVDLARNDLGRHGKNVVVKELKEIQYFSHVIHLVSKVEAKLPPDHNSMEVFGNTFPAGTLSGAPKYKAIELINSYENVHRSFYGGALGFIDLNGNMNQAIVIRSFLSKDNVLTSQAGAGVVSESNEENELQEVNNKLGALKKALQLATNL